MASLSESAPHPKEEGVSPSNEVAHLPPEGTQFVDLEFSDLSWVAQQEREIFGAGAWSEDLLREDFRYGGRRYRGVKHDNALVAYAIYGFDGDAFTLMNIAVVPGFRGRGIAQAIMRDFLNEADTYARGEAWLEVAVDNTAALALYRKYGFEDVRVRRAYYQPGNIDALVMLRPGARFVPAN